ncbi:MAG: hypothetical protein JF606_05525 [Burkholderiales bacterium]|nr:hypothetical protein [Burkholderiales bacterium]
MPVPPSLSVLISKAGPRDGLQSALRPVPTADKACQPFEPIYGMTTNAGVPKGFVKGTARV